MKSRLSDEEIESLLQRILNDLGTIHFVGSPEVIEAAEKVMSGVLPELDKSENVNSDFLDELDLFQVVARKDLGHPSP
jgi:hypothetical protein